MVVASSASAREVVATLEEEEMTSIHVEREVAAPAARVWAMMTDVTRTPDVLSSVTAVERVDDGGEFGVGTRWRETRTVMGRETTEEMRVNSVDPGRDYTVEADSRGRHHVTVLTIEPRDEDRSRVFMRFEVRPTSRAGRIRAATVGRLLRGPTRKRLASDLEEIALAAEDAN